MTLNLTIVGPKCIYQSADYRLTDWTTGQQRDFETQKAALVRTDTWDATVCFAGVGRAATTDVSEWLAECVRSIEPTDTFDTLIERLLHADRWLSAVPIAMRRHSFSIGAFVRGEPIFCLISNFEHIAGAPSRRASPTLRVERHRPSRPRTFVSGQSRAVGAGQLKRLAKMAAHEADREKVHKALARVNRDAAATNEFISPACFTTRVTLTGESDYIVHGMEKRAFIPPFEDDDVMDIARRIAEKHFGGPVRIVQSAGARVEASDEFHQLQIRERPDDANVHSNYGAYLQDAVGDLTKAEAEYRKAIELNPNHSNALGNLAGLLLLRAQAQSAEAENLYRRAFDVDPRNENVSFNYSSFLIRCGDLDTAETVLKAGLSAHAYSARLKLAMAQLLLLLGRYDEAPPYFEGARGTEVDQRVVETGYAVALHFGGAPHSECIDAYHVAIAVDPSNAVAKLNLAEILFIEGRQEEATRQLQESLKTDLPPELHLQAQFLLLAHTRSNPDEIIAAIRALVSKGAVFVGEARASVEHVRKQSSQKAELLERVAKVMTGELDASNLAEVLEKW